MSEIFLAKVIQVYPQKVMSGTGSDNITHEGYTIDVQPEVARLPVRGVKVLSTTSGNNSGFIWLPSVNDWVLCTYIDDYLGHTAICLGTIKHPVYNQIKSDGEQYQDCTLSHQSGSYIRMRDLERGKNPSSNKSRSEIKLHHKTGSEIEITEPTVGKSEINITHSSGTKITIDSTGAIIINVNEGTTITGKDITISAQNVKLTDKTTIIGDENLASGIHTQLTHPFCYFTGVQFPGSPTNKSS